MGPSGEGGSMSLVPPLDPPLQLFDLKTWGQGGLPGVNPPEMNANSIFCPKFQEFPMKLDILETGGRSENVYADPPLAR